MSLAKLFPLQWDSVPVCMIDVETTGRVPGIDAVCQLGLARFEQGQLVAKESWLVNPGRAIPAEATAIHGIANATVSGEPPLAEVMALARVKQLLDGAQPGAYNAPVDRDFMPPGSFNRDWPWLDAMVCVCAQDLYVRGSGRHRLPNACARHGLRLPLAHDAAADAAAAGALLYQLVGYGELTPLRKVTLGSLLLWTAKARATDWFKFIKWVNERPPRENEKAAGDG